jgi:hypothetical protein
VDLILNLNEKKSWLSKVSFFYSNTIDNYENVLKILIFEMKLQIESILRTEKLKI